MCIRCKVFYTGQCSTAYKLRLSNHKSIILNFEQKELNTPLSNLSKLYKNYPLAVHFLENKKCKFEEHLRFCIFRKDILDLQDRLNIESDIIHLIRLFGGTVCNDYIPNHNFIKQLGFANIKK